jgi:phosphoglycolate phosphatase
MPIVPAADKPPASPEERPDPPERDDPEPGTRRRERCALVLFDIDGTVLVAGDAEHKAALIDAVADVYDVAITFDGFSLGGRLDAEIVRVLLGAAGVDAAAIEAGLDATIARMGARFSATFDRAGYRTRVLPGVTDAVAAVQLVGHTVGVLTGNARAVAETRLASAGLHALLTVGAFGDRAHARADLVAEARADAERRHGLVFPARATVLVGDTPRDIAAAREAGARIVAVPTGVVSEAALREAEPDVLLPDLTDATRLVAAIEWLLSR